MTPTTPSPSAPTITRGLPTGAITEPHGGQEALSLVLHGTGWQYTYNVTVSAMLRMVLDTAGPDAHDVTAYVWDADNEFETVTRYVGTLTACGTLPDGTDGVTVSGVPIDFDVLAAIHLHD